MVEHEQCYVTIYFFLEQNFHLFQHRHRHIRHLRRHHMLVKYGNIIITQYNKMKKQHSGH